MAWRALWRWVFFLICCPIKGSILFESGGPFWALETDGSVDVILVRKGDVSAPASVDFEIRFQGTIAADDFVNPSGRVEFSSGTTKSTFVLQLKQDGRVETVEWFDIIL